jgi:hypothetical protein
MTDQPWLQERKDHPLGGGKHTFKITVVMRGDGADYEGRITTVTEKAYSLRDALKQAIERPLKDWFEDDIREEQYLDREERNRDHEEALREGTDAPCSR